MYLSKSWQIAEIKAIAKSKENDKTFTNVYYFILLISIISKRLKLIIVNRLFYLAKIFEKKYYASS